MADADDAEFLAWVMLAASRAHLARGLWDLIIGADEAGCLDYLRRLALAEPRSLYHYESFLVAEIDGAPAAALCGFETRDGAWAIAGRRDVQRAARPGMDRQDETAASYQRIAPIWAACMPSGCRSGFRHRECGDSARVSPARIRSALSSTKCFTTRFRRGCRLAQITTYIGNHAAQSAYEKSGFQSARTRNVAPNLRTILGVPGFRPADTRH